MTNESNDPLRFRDVWHYYANLICYLRITLCVAASFTIGVDAHVVSAALLLIAYLLDIVDGRIARRFNQCTIFGDGLDWGADLFVDVLLMMWWMRLEPALFGWLTLAMIVEIAAALFDFAIHATDRFPPRGRQRGFCVILEWSMPGHSWSLFGWLIWLAFPFFVVARCLDLGGAAHFKPVVFMQLALAPLAACFVWSNMALLISGINRWTEKRP